MLLTLGLVLAGSVAYLKLPVAPLPQIDFPTITVFAAMPGASPDIMAANVATPLERHLGVIADVSEMTSENTVGQTRITLQFGLDRDIDGAGRTDGADNPELELGSGCSYTIDCYRSCLELGKDDHASRYLGVVQLHLRTSHAEGRIG